MSLRVLLAAVVGGLVLGSPLFGDEVWVRGQEKPIVGGIKAESPKGVALGKETVPAETIVDVVYDLNPIDVRLGLYRQAVKAEKDANDPANDAKRKALVAEALKKYEDALAKVAAADKNAKRHLEYKVAVLAAREAQEEGKAPDAGLAKLKAFVEKHPDGWQITGAIQALAQFQAAQKDYAAAEASYRKLASLDVPPEVKQEAELQAIQVAIQGGSKTARQELDTLVTMLPKDSKFAARARILQVEIQLANKDAAQVDKAVATLRQIIKDATDRQVKAEAHNALGAYYFQKEQYKDARWEFLWVDVVYNQDKAEHAKALYYLWQTFDKLGDAERSQECRETLLADRQFAGLEFQRLAQSQAKASR